MAGSRLEKLGTIFTRVNGLIKSGAMKIDDRPIWYDVYRAFPPESEPHFDKPAKPIKVPNIFFKEDVFRAEFHKKARGQLPPIYLKDSNQTQNATKVAVDMVTTNPSLSVEQVVDTLSKSNVLYMYNASGKRANSTSNTDTVDKSAVIDTPNATSETKV